MVQSGGGFTLVEVLLVLTVIGVVIAVSIPLFGGYLEQVSSAACMANRSQFRRMYEAHLIAEGKRHSLLEFGAFLDSYDKEICPGSGVIAFLEQRISCSVHQDNDEDDGESVPFL